MSFKAQICCFPSLCWLEPHSGHHNSCLVELLQRKKTRDPPVCTLNEPGLLYTHFPLFLHLTVLLLSYLAPLFKYTLSWRHVVTPGTKRHGSPPYHTRNLLQIHCQWVTRAVLTGGRACLISTEMKVGHFNNLATVPSFTSSYSPAFTCSNPQSWSSWSSTVSQGLMLLPWLPNNPGLPRNQ